MKDELAKKKPKLQGIYELTIKYEGWDTYTYFNGRTFEVPLSSAGRPIPSLEWIPEALRYAPYPGFPCWIRAEAYKVDTPFAILNGLLNRSVGDYHFRDGLVLKVHDLILASPQQDIAQDRNKAKKEFCDWLKRFNLFENVAPLYEGEFDQKIWKYYFEQITADGGEGIVGKRLSGIYQPGKRNSDIIKEKLECTVETLADRVEVGKGEKGNTSYTIVSKRKNGTEVRTVMSRHKDIAAYLNDSSYIVGRVLQLKAMQEYEDGQLRQPVFQYIRYDKQPSEID